MAENKEIMWARMEEFADTAQNRVLLCKNEEQTKVSLINPYLAILGYDVEDPNVCNFEYTADLVKKGEKVDYAIMRDRKAAILIEAKVASMDISRQVEPTSQLHRYFLAAAKDPDAEVNFAVFTNGVVWKWYSSHGNNYLEDKPFKTHDVRHPDPADKEWLWSVSGYVSDSRLAIEQANAERMRMAFRKWIRDIRHSPSDEFIKVLMTEVKKKKYGLDLEE